MKERTAHRIFLATVLVGAAVRVAALLQLSNLESMEGEGYSKLHLFLQWIESPLPYPDTNFGPLHMALLWIPWKLTGSLVTGGRVVSLLFSVGLFFPLYHFVRKTQGLAPAVVAGALLSLSALPVSIGISTIAEGPHVFFFVAALAVFAHLTDEREKADLRFIFAFAALAACALALRFESWIFLPIWPVVLWRKRGIKTAALAAALLAIFPLVHMYVCWSISGHPLSFILQSQGVTAINSAAAPLSARAVGWFRTLIAAQGWALFAVSMAGILYAALMGRGRFITGLFLWLFAVLETQALRAAMAPELTRYASLLVVLAIPPAAQLICDVAERALRRRPYAPAAAMAAAFLLSAGSLPYLAAVKEETRIADVEYVMAGELKKRLTADDRVLLVGDNHPLMVVESGFPRRLFRLPDYPDGVHPDPQSCRGIFAGWRPTWIIFDTSDIAFTRAIGVASCAESNVYGEVFTPVFQHQRWCALKRAEDKP